MKRFKIYINGKYLESYSKLSEAEARVRSYERKDRYERDSDTMNIYGNFIMENGMLERIDRMKIIVEFEVSLIGK